MLGKDEQEEGIAVADETETDIPQQTEDTYVKVDEEEHLELFYMVSSGLLIFMIIIIIKHHLNYTKKKTAFLANLKKLKQDEELNTLSSNFSGFMRQNSYH